MPAESSNGHHCVFDIVSDDAQSLVIVEPCWHNDGRRIAVPVSKSMVRQDFPWEAPVWIYFSARCNIAMTYKIFLRNFIFCFQGVEQDQEAVYLGVSKRFKSIIVQLNTNTGRIDIRIIAPFG